MNILPRFTAFLGITPISIPRRNIKLAATATDKVTSDCLLPNASGRSYLVAYVIILQVYKITILYFSFGMLFWSLLTHEDPFDGKEGHCCAVNKYSS